MSGIPAKETMDQIADLFKGFADSTRVHILSLLHQHQELCVTDIAEAVERFAAMSPEETARYAENSRKGAEEYSFRNLTMKLLDILK